MSASKTKAPVKREPPEARLSNREPATWARWPDGTVVCVSAARAPWTPAGEPTTNARAYELPAPAHRTPSLAAAPAAGVLGGIVDRVNWARAARGWDLLDGALTDEDQRRAKEGGAEHASYPITIVLPYCGCCGGYPAARCACPWKCTLPVDVLPDPNRAPCACAAIAATRAA